MVKVEVFKKDGGFHALTIGGEYVRPLITVDYVAQMSVWLVNLQVEYNGLRFDAPEYMYAINIDEEILSAMAKNLERSINGRYEE